MISEIKFHTMDPIAEEETKKIAFVGLDRTGKTTMLKRLSKGILTRTMPTQGFNIERFSLLGTQFNVFDLGGQDTYQIFWEQFLPQQEAIVFFIDAKDTDRLPKVRLALKKILSLAKSETIVMILANKQDLPDALSVSDLLEKLDLDLVSKVKHLHFFPVSAKTGLGIYEAFEWLSSTLKIDSDPQKCNLQGLYVYEKNTGIPLVSIDEYSARRPRKNTLNLQNPMVSRDPTMVTALHSAIGSFTNEITESELKTVTFQSQKTKQLYQITSVGYKTLVCILITTGENTGTLTSTLGKTILEYVQNSIDSLKSSLPLQDDHLRELVNIIDPFILNKTELQENVLNQEITAPSDSVETVDFPSSAENIISQENVSVSNTQEELSVTVAPNISSVQEQITRSCEEIKRKSIQESNYPKFSITSSSKAARVSEFTETKSENQQNNPEPDDEIDIYRMSVKERIKYLQQHRKRLQDS